LSDESGLSLAAHLAMAHYAPPIASGLVGAVVKDPCRIASSERILETVVMNATMEGFLSGVQEGGGAHWDKYAFTLFHD
jgi:hypothetical protein